MTASFTKHLKIVASVHIILIIGLFVSGWMKSCTKSKKDVIIPMEFLVEMPAAEQTAPVNDIPSPIKQPVKKPIKKPVKKPTKKPIKISDTVITNPLNKRPPKKLLTAEEIQKLLDKGAKPSDRTVIPDDETIHFAMVKQAFHDAWAQPSAAEAGDAVAVAEIRFAADGAVISAKLKKPSGVAVLDQSVRRSLKYVKRVSGLTPDFLKRNSVITISFRVE
jgi:hypothetical protein